MRPAIPSSPGPVDPGRRQDQARPCLKKLVPIIQRAQVDYLANPTETNKLVLDLVKQYNDGWVYTEGLANYAIEKMLTWLMNSLVIGVMAALAVTLSSAFVAFGFAYFRFPGRNLLFGLVLATMMLPTAVTMIPNYLVWNWLGLTNTQVPLWAHNLFGSAFYIFLLRQFFLGLPRELFEAARVDGASYLQLFGKIALPLTKPALIVTFVFAFRANWTDLMRPLSYLRDNSLFTLPRGLKVILDQFGQGGEGHWEVVLAASVIATVPMLIIFFLGQRYFVEGIATTGRKG